MKNKNLLIVIGLVVVVGLFMVFKQTQSAPTDSGAPAETTAETSEPAADAPAGPAFWEGKTITVVVPHGAGGGYDTYARMIAPYMEKYMPGVTAVIIENVTGAGGNVGRNQVWAAEPDGLTIGFTSGTSMVYSQLAESAGVVYDCAEWTWLGRALGDPSILSVAKNSEFTDIQKFLAAGRPLKFAVSGVGDDDYFNLGLCAKALGFEVLPVTGYDGTAEGSLAAIRGEVDAFQTSFTSMMPLINNGEVIPIMVYGDQRRPELPDLPNMTEVATTQEGKDMAQTITNISAVNRLYFAPPNMDPALVETWQGIFEKVLNDPELVAAGATSGRPVEYMSGDDLKAAVDAVFEESIVITELLKEIVSWAE